MQKLRHVVLVVQSYRARDRGVAQGVGDYIHENPHWSLYMNRGQVDWNDFKGWHADGLIAGFDTLNDWPPPGLTASPVPLVSFGGPSPSPDSVEAPPNARIMSDHHAIGVMAAEHMMDLGLRNFAYFGMDGASDSIWSDLRREGFTARLREGGFAPQVYRSEFSNKAQWAERQAAIGQWLEGLNKPIGVMACFDKRAWELLEACRVLGISVPDDVSIIGVDNDEWICNLAKPTITSVVTGTRRIGYEAAALLHRLMEGVDAPSAPVLVGPERVVARGSSDTLGFANAEVTTAVKFIRNHACDPITVTDVLDHAGLSASKAHRDFKAALGRSVHQEIQRVQMEQVKHLLTHTNQSIKNIAYTAGYENSKYMSKLFHKLVGTTPSDYRRNRSRRDL